MKSVNRSLALKLLPLLLALSVTGCAQVSPPIPPVSVQPARIPPLAQSARVSQVPTPLICSQGCSSGIQTSLSRSVDMLTPSESPVSPANVPTIP